MYIYIYYNNILHNSIYYIIYILLYYIIVYCIILYYIILYYIILYYNILYFIILHYIILYYIILYYIHGMDWHGMCFGNSFIMFEDSGSACPQSLYLQYLHYKVALPTVISWFINPLICRYLMKYHDISTKNPKVVGLITTQLTGTCCLMKSTKKHVGLIRIPWDS